MTPNDAAEFPKKLGRVLLKNIVKKLSPDDAIMLIGTTNQPWNCSYGLMRQCYERFVVFPPVLDYGTAVMAWNKGLQSKKIFNFDVSSLAKLTRNYTIGDILEFINQYVDLQRRMQ